MAKILNREIDSCMSCPFMCIVGDDEKNTVIACKNREAAPGGSEFNARVILKQPMDHVVADVEIPGWCPLPDMKAVAIVYGVDLAAEGSKDTSVAVTMAKDSNGDWRIIDIQESKWCLELNYTDALRNDESGTHETVGMCKHWSRRDQDNKLCQETLCPKRYNGKN